MFIRNSIWTIIKEIKKSTSIKKCPITNTNKLLLFWLLGCLGIGIKADCKLYFLSFFPCFKSENSFRLLVKFLYLVGTEEFGAYSPNWRLFKIWPILDDMREKFMSIYVPDKNIFIDWVEWPACIEPIYSPKNWELQRKNS